MKRLIPSRAALLITVILAGCSTSGPSESGGGRFTYPLGTGDRWEYVREFVTPTTFDSLGVVVIDTLYSTCSTEITGIDTLDHWIETSVLHETIVEDSGHVYEHDTYYGNRDDGLYMYAYQPGSSFVSPKPSTRERLIFKGMVFGSARELLRYFERGIWNAFARDDSLFYEDPPVRCLEYPMRVGGRWTYRETGNPWAIDKRVTGVETVSVPAGEFSCYEVEWLIDFDDDGEWDEDIDLVDHVSEEGLIRRWLYFSDIVVVGPDDPEPIDTLDVSDESRLTAYSVE